MGYPFGIDQHYAAEASPSAVCCTAGFPGYRTTTNARPLSISRGPLDHIYWINEICILMSTAHSSYSRFVAAWVLDVRLRDGRTNGVVDKSTASWRLLAKAMICRMRLIRMVLIDRSFRYGLIYYVAFIFELFVGAVSFGLLI